MSKTVDGISLQTLKRLPLYLEYLEKEKEMGIHHVSMPKIGEALNLTDVLVKKDLSSIINEQGKPKVGHNINNLINDIKDFLGYNDSTKIALVGCGNLGNALLNYDGFQADNMEIVIAFDNDPAMIGQTIHNIPVLSIDKITDICQRLKIHIGIITVPKANAQEVCDLLISAGIRAIWNFAPINLRTNSNVIVQTESLGSSLRILAKKLSCMLKEE